MTTQPLGLEKPEKTPPKAKARIMPRCGVCAHSARLHVQGGCSQGPMACYCPKYQPKRIAKKARLAQRQRPVAKSDKKIPRRKKTTLAKLLDRLWDLFRHYIYERDGAVCISCGAAGLEKSNRQAGHLFNAGNNAGIRFEPKNVHVQCMRCNIRLKGNGAPYALAFLDRYGVEEYQRLAAQRKAGHRWRAPQVRELIEALERSPADYECLYAEKYGLSGITARPFETDTDVSRTEPPTARLSSPTAAHPEGEK